MIFEIPFAAVQKDKAKYISSLPRVYAGNPSSNTTSLAISSQSAYSKSAITQAGDINTASFTLPTTLV
jgi:hypothetical protein